MEELKLPPAAKDAYHVFTKSTDTQGQKHYLVVTKNEATALGHVLEMIGESYPRPQITIERVIRVRFEDTDDEMYSL